MSDLDDVSIKVGYDTFLEATEDNQNEVDALDEKGEVFCIQYTGDQYVLHISAPFNPGIFIDPEKRPLDATEQPWTWAGVKLTSNPLELPVKDLRKMMLKLKTTF